MSDETRTNETDAAPPRGDESDRFAEESELMGARSAEQQRELMKALSAKRREELMDPGSGRAAPPPSRADRTRS